MADNGRGRRAFVARQSPYKPKDPEYILIQHIGYYKHVLAYYHQKLTPEQHDYYTKRLASYEYLLTYGDPNNTPAD